MSYNSKPTYGVQSPVQSVVVSADLRFFAVHCSNGSVEVRESSTARVLFRTSRFCVDRLLLEEHLLKIYYYHSYEVIDWRKGETQIDEKGVFLEGCQGLFTFANPIAKIVSIDTEDVVWEKTFDKASCIEQICSGNFVLLRVGYLDHCDFQLWNIILNKQIDFKNIIKEQTGFIFYDEEFAEMQLQGDLPEIRFHRTKSLLYIDAYMRGQRVVISFDIKKNIAKAVELPNVYESLYESSCTEEAVSCFVIFDYEDVFFYIDSNKAIVQFDIKKNKIIKTLFKIPKGWRCDVARTNSKRSCAVFSFAENGFVIVSFETGSVVKSSFVLECNFLEFQVINETIVLDASRRGSIALLDVSTNHKSILNYEVDGVSEASLVDQKLVLLHDNSDVTTWSIEGRAQLSRVVAKEKIIRKRTEIVNIIREDFEILLDRNERTLEFKSDVYPRWKINYFEELSIVWLYFVHDQILEEKIYFGNDALYSLHVKDGKIDLICQFLKHDEICEALFLNGKAFVFTNAYRMHCVDLISKKIDYSLDSDLESVHSVIYLANINSVLIAGHYRSKIIQIDLTLGKVVREIVDHCDSIVKLFLIETENRKELVSVARNGCIKIWDPESFALKGTLYSLPAVLNKNLANSWAYVKTNGKIFGSERCQEYFADPL